MEQYLEKCRQQLGQEKSTEVWRIMKNTKQKKKKKIRNTKEFIGSRQLK